MKSILFLLGAVAAAQTCTTPGGQPGEWKLAIENGWAAYRCVAYANPIKTISVVSVASGKDLDAKWDPATGTLVISLPAGPAGERGPRGLTGVPCSTLTAGQLHVVLDDGTCAPIRVAGSVGASILGAASESESVALAPAREMAALIRALAFL